MSQRFKSVYYSDCEAARGRGGSLTLAFGEGDADLYEQVRLLSSVEVRDVLGHPSFRALRTAAAAERLTVNALCLRRLREEMDVKADEPGQLYFARVYLDPIHATRKGGESEPLHNWYPLLEGYSPKYVQRIIEEFAPSARRVFDPFAGTGTTPLTAARMGLDSYYCEVNPLCQHIIKVKVDALTMDQKARGRVLELLSDCLLRIPGWLKDGPVDKLLLQAYRQAFRKSEFFTPEVLAEVLRARTLVDDMTCIDPLAAEFLGCAAVASLVPASLMKRAGDLRYKTDKELTQGQPTLQEAMQDRLAQMVRDLATLEYVERRPLLICEDAKRLGSLPSHDFDCVVTSPPYLNGTNYFRNTRLELWFLRCLASKQDLTAFRRKAVTAGINGVTRAEKQFLELPEIDEVVAALERNAYDSRIPRMVGSYFHDLAEVFDACKRHLIPGACVAIDIGDSCYGGVHVPTDRILEKLLAEKGLRRISKTVLRKRMSRDGTPLHQALLVALYEPTSRARPKPYATRPAGPDWLPKWRNFKHTLPHQKRPYAKRNWGHPLHSLCSYQGKMKPALAHHLLRAFVDSPARILDPFAGVGTIPFEAGLRGMEAYGFEISPAAYTIAAAKCGAANPTRCSSVLDQLEGFLAREEPAQDDLRSAHDVAFNGRVEDFYESRTLREVLVARRYFREHPPVADEELLVMASLLHILHGNRPYALSRRSHNTTPFAPTGEFEYRPLMPRLREKVTRGLRAELPSRYQAGRISFQDATSWWPQEVDELDAVITSPPFYSSTRFHLANWLRLWFCGWERPDFKSKPLGFLEEQQRKSFAAYEPVFRQCRERLKPGGIVVLHLGKSRKCDMAQELSAIAAKWFEVQDLFDESVAHCERHGVSDKGTVAAHQYLVLS